MSELKFRGKQPTTLAFGTSGLRGLVTDITDLEAYINTKGFLRFALDTNDTKVIAFIFFYNFK
jgi:phosphomannomutase